MLGGEIFLRFIGGGWFRSSGFDALGEGALSGWNWSTVLAYKIEFGGLDGGIEVCDQAAEGLWDGDGWE
jgi:hypothetical protein